MVEDDRNNYGEPISISPDNVRAEIGEEIILTCQCSNPEFTLTWTKLQDRLPPNAQNRSKTYASLPAVRLSDFESFIVNRKLLCGTRKRNFPVQKSSVKKSFTSSFSSHEGFFSSSLLLI